MSFLITWAETCPVFMWGDWLAIAIMFSIVLCILTPADKSK